MKHVKILAVAMVAALAMASCAGNAQKDETQVQEAVGTVETTRAHYAPNQPVAVPTVLDFSAVWCVPCKKLKVPFEEAAKLFEGKVDFRTVDFDQDPETCKAFGVEQVPCVVMINTDGSFSVYPSLSDFISDDDLKLAPEEVNAIILNSITQKVNSMLAL